MKKYHLRKGMSVGFILLLIGVAVIPIIDINGITTSHVKDLVKIMK